MRHIGLTLSKAAEYIGRHPKTLQGMDRKGILPAKRTSTGRRYWHKSTLDEYLGLTTAVRERKNYAYCRVSSSAQRPDLKNQRRIVERFCVAKGLGDVEYIEEIGGGLNFKRPKFLALIDEIVSGGVETLVVAHKDRLARFGFDLLRHLCEAYNCALIIINVEEVSPEQEMVQDLMAITHCFSARLYGLGKYKKALKEALK